MGSDHLTGTPRKAPTMSDGMECSDDSPPIESPLITVNAEETQSKRRPRQCCGMKASAGRLTLYARSAPVRRTRADPFTLHLIEVNGGIVVLNRKTQTARAQVPNSRHERV